MTTETPTKLRVKCYDQPTRIPVNGEIYYKCLECLDTGMITVDAGYCGGCEVCGSREQHEERCPHCNAPDEETERDDLPF
jgi:hypothetical protein